MTTSPSTSQVLVQPPARGLRWVARRAAIGLLLLLTFAFGGALLLDASIDRAAEAGEASETAEE